MEKIDQKLIWKHYNSTPKGGQQYSNLNGMWITETPKGSILFHSWTGEAGYGESMVYVPDEDHEWSKMLSEKAKEVK